MRVDQSRQQRLLAKIDNLHRRCASLISSNFPTSIMRPSETATAPLSIGAASIVTTVRARMIIRQL